MLSHHAASANDDHVVELGIGVDTGHVEVVARRAARLQRLLGDRKIDVLVVDPQTSLEAIHLAARAGGMLL